MKTPIKVCSHDKTIIDLCEPSVSGDGNQYAAFGGAGLEGNAKNAEHIVLCVNAHDGLVEALKFIANDYGNSTKPIRRVAIEALRSAGVEVQR